MTAGTGVTHSEYNPSPSDGTRFLQIWLLPNERGLTPGYEQKQFDDERRGRLKLVASPDGRDGSVTVHQDVRMYASQLAAGELATHELSSDRHAWIQVVRGTLNSNGERLTEGDGAAISDIGELSLQAETDAELLLFDLA